MGIKSSRLLIPVKKSKRYIKRQMINVGGWTTKKKLIIFESDDWGSIRMASREAYDRLLLQGDKVDRDPFTRYDALASKEDLTNLFEVLCSFKDFKGNHPIITANCAMANPDFEKIRKLNFKEYYWEPFTDTLSRYEKHGNSFELWKKGIGEKVFFPQLHCREHINITRWMKDLRESKEDVVRAFEHHMISTGDSFTTHNRYAYMDAFNYDHVDEEEILRQTLIEGSQIFKNTFGYESESFIAPCYIWSENLEKTLNDIGVRYIQGNRVQLMPDCSEGTTKFNKKKHLLGERNTKGQVYLIRNCEFEPSWRNADECVENCLRHIKIAFWWNKPATISTHRLNYIGFIDKKNRDNNLKLLSRLLTEILKRWPDVEFISTTDLGKMI